MESVVARMCWYKASSMVSESACWRKGTSISSRSCQSGRDAAEERAATVELVWGEGPGSHPSISLTNDWERDEDAKKAAGAWREVLRRLIPPRLLGREAFSQDHSDSGPPRMDSQDSLMAMSKSLVDWLMWLEGHVRIVYENLGSAKHERRRVHSS